MPRLSDTFLDRIKKDYEEYCRKHSLEYKMDWDFYLAGYLAGIKRFGNQGTASDKYIRALKKENEELREKLKNG